MSNEINELKLLLAELNTVIAVSEEKLTNKLDEAEFLKRMSERDGKLYAAINKINDRLNGLYVKVVGASGAVVGIIELITRNS